MRFKISHRTPIRRPAGLPSDGERYHYMEVSQMKKFWVYRATSTVAAIAAVAVASGAANKFF